MIREDRSLNLEERKLSRLRGLHDEIDVTSSHNCADRSAPTNMTKIHMQLVITSIKLNECHYFDIKFPGPHPRLFWTACLPNFSKPVCASRSPYHSISGRDILTAVFGFHLQRVRQRLTVHTCDLITAPTLYMHWYLSQPLLRTVGAFNRRSGLLATVINFLHVDSESRPFLRGHREYVPKPTPTSDQVSDWLAVSICYVASLTLFIKLRLLRWLSLINSKMSALYLLT
jgi:hypothetical protein